MLDPVANAYEIKVRKLVNALVGQRYALVELRPLVKRGHAHLVGKAIRFIDRALKGTE